MLGLLSNAFFFTLSFRTRQYGRLSRQFYGYNKRQLNIRKIMMSVKVGEDYWLTSHLLRYPKFSLNNTPNFYVNEKFGQLYVFFKWQPQSLFLALHFPWTFVRKSGRKNLNIFTCYSQVHHFESIWLLPFAFLTYIDKY